MRKRRESKPKGNTITVARGFTVTGLGAKGETCSDFIEGVSAWTLTRANNPLPCTDKNKAWFYRIHPKMSQDILARLSESRKEREKIENEN